MRFVKRISMVVFLALGIGLAGPIGYGFLAVAHAHGQATQTADRKPLRLYVYVAGDPAYHVTSTLIYGQTESVLVDAQFFLSDASKLADHIAGTHTTLRAIFITHPDLDHWIGLAVLHEKFPAAPIYMTKGALDEFKKSVGTDLEGRRKRAPEETPKAVPTPMVLPSTALMVDGQPILIVPDQQGDFAAAPLNSLVFVPSLRAVVAGDIVFSDTHLWLADSSTNTRRSWLATLGLIKALKPEIVVAGHGPREPEKGTAAVAFTERYLQDFEALAASPSSEDQFVSAMQRKYPNLGQPRFLKIAARTIFAKQANSQNNAVEGVTAAEARHAIEQANALWGRARVSIDRNAFEQALAPGFYAQFPDRRLTREEFIQRISSYPSGVKLTRFDPQVLTMQQEGDTWVALVSQKIESEHRGEDDNAVTEYALGITRDGWKKFGTEWKALFSEIVGVERWQNGQRPPFKDW